MGTFARSISIAAALVAFTVPNAAQAQQWTLSGYFTSPASNNIGQLMVSVEDDHGLPVKGLRAGSFEISEYMCNLTPSGGCSYFPATVINSPPLELIDGVYRVNFSISEGFHSTFGMLFVRVSSIAIIPTSINGGVSVLRTQHAQIVLHH